MSSKAAGPDEVFMEAALREARKGLGRTSPNPCVGAVIVKEGKVIARGWHARAGGPHAEIVALQKAGELARNAVLYVTLEPCNHTGRTPPCSRAVAASGINRVVTGMTDPNPLVSGQGCAYLRSRGIAVTSGILEDKCRALNLPFEKRITTGLPWIVLKAGVTMDGRIAPGPGKNCWITGESARAEVHRMRDRLDAILIGSTTALTDDPSLTARHIGRRKYRDPLRVVLDTELRLSPRARMLTGNPEAETWIFCGPEADQNKAAALEKAGARIILAKLDMEGRVDLHFVMHHMVSEGKNSVLVEGGGEIHAALLKQDLVDQVNLFFAPFFLGKEGVPLIGDLGEGSQLDSRRFVISRSRRFGEDLMIELARR